MLSGSSPTADTPPRGRSHYEKCSNTHGAHRSSHVMHAVLLEKRRVDPNAQRPETLVGREQRAKPPPKNREPTPCAPCDSRDRPSVREVLRTTGVGGLVASWSADFGCSSDGGLLGRGVAVGSNNATVESACSKRASYSPNLLEGGFSEVRQKVSIKAASEAVDQGAAGCYNIVVESGSPVSPLRGARPSSCPYSAECVEGKFSEVRIQDPA